MNAWRKKWARGEVVVIRYADDVISGFQHQADADRFLENLRERLGKFGLELHPDKTRRIEFGRFAEQNRNRRGEGKPDTFDFLGFKHIRARSCCLISRSFAPMRLRIVLCLTTNRPNLFFPLMWPASPLPSPVPR